VFSESASTVDDLLIKKCIHAFHFRTSRLTFFENKRALVNIAAFISSLIDPLRRVSGSDTGQGNWTTVFICVDDLGTNMLTILLMAIKYHRLIFGLGNRFNTRWRQN
jgi:hypothetical protein